MDDRGYLLEIKATASGEVRLTPSQATTAADEPYRFVLCVVDLRGVPSERLNGERQPPNVEPLARIVTGVGHLTRETCDLIDMASEEDVATLRLRSGSEAQGGDAASASPPGGATANFSRFAASAAEYPHPTAMRRRRSNFNTGQARLPASTMERSHASVRAKKPGGERSGRAVQLVDFGGHAAKKLESYAWRNGHEGSRSFPTILSDLSEKACKTLINHVKSGSPAMPRES